MDIALMNINDLKEHEEVDLGHLKKLKSQIIREKVLKKPIAVDKNTKIIIDGHTRFNSLKQLGYSKIPVFLIDYSSPEIFVRTWKGDRKITKEDVLSAGLNGKKLPPKTSKNIVKVGDNFKHVSELEKRINTPLEELR